ncbi:MAG: bifunctional 4-hydroxy-2-oxoglutarate aldolase/2-dehydro-3-deoxy-phosphogluconate aldolase [Mucilaginibacter sp.]|nr:bifunctional 4-hydroxy-2-oxoglutarate aldolase/2-dehydro-3-deoxy-phosphogluconate aldolase [Mucilaginibacter sp.]
MNSKQAVTDSVLKQRMLPLYFHEDAEVSVQVARTLYKAGVRVFEYTNRGDAAFKNFGALKELQQKEMPGMHLGVGTVKTTEEARVYINAGADFIVSPIVNPEVGKMAHDRDMLWIPGCMTPSEIHVAQQHSAAIIKLFPANILGVEFMSSIKDLFRGQLFIPTGGVELEAGNIGAWFKAGVCAVGMGSKLITKQILEEHLYDQLYTKTLKALELVQSVY